MSELFKPETLKEVFNPDDYDLETVDYNNLMSTFVKFNQVIEEYTKLMSSDSPYITNFYLNKGFKNVFSLYHWYRTITPIFEKMPVKRILFTKHLQLLWSNIGDLFATIIESKFIRDAREVYSIVSKKHKTEADFLASLHYHICSEVFKQEDIITYFLNHSKFFLECLIDIMKLLLSDEGLGKDPVQREARGNRFGDRYNARGLFSELHRQPPREPDENIISQLAGMGFSRRLAIQALNRNHNSLELAAEYLLTLPPEVLEADEEEEKKEDQNQDAQMESEEKKENEEEKMEVDDPDIVVCTPDGLVKAIKVWLEMLFNWILKGFNSNLTDIDVENITQFILKYISKESDVELLMKTLIESLGEIYNFVKDTEKDKKDATYQKHRKSVLKKAATLSKIISHLTKSYLKRSEFLESLMNLLSKLLKEHKDKCINFIPESQEIKAKKSVNSQDEMEYPKSEAEIFKDIMGNCINIMIAGYGFYKLACSDDTTAQLEKELKIQEEDKKEEEKKDKKDESKAKNDSKYDKLVNDFFTELNALEENETVDKYISDWKQKFKEQDFMNLCLLLIEHSGENFDDCFSVKSFNKFLFLLLKLIEEKENCEEFVKQNGFKKLLNLKSNKKKVVDNSRSYFTNIVIRLVENDAALQEITENIIKKSLYFKHDEEFTKEMKEKAKEASGKKKSKDKSKNKEKDSKEKSEKKTEEQEKPKEDSKEESKEQSAQSPSLKKSESEGVIKVESKSLMPKPKLTKSSESTVLKKSEIAFNTFKNCSGVRLNQFIEQMNFIESRAKKVFLKACSNLCEIENIKEYDTDMNVKSEYKIIKLKDTVLKEHIAKITKENSANHKNLPAGTDKKDMLPSQTPGRSGSQTARVKGASSSTLNAHGKKDNFLVSSLMSTQNFFPKPNRNIILIIMDKIVDKYCNYNFENWEASDKDKEEKNLNSQCIFNYGTLLTILSKIIRTYPSTASLVLLFKSKKLKHFSSFIDFLVRKIYPLGFMRWAILKSEDKPNAKKLEETWRTSDFKDAKPENSMDKEDDILYRVGWDKNQEWENVIIENMRTLIDFNIFMSPQEKKIKLEIKRHLISGLLEKTIKIAGPTSLRNVITLSTSLICLRKLLSVAETNQPLYYNKENVFHTIKELRANNRIFKILSDLMKSVNPLSPEAEIIDPLLIPLVERMTFSEDKKRTEEEEKQLLGYEEAKNEADQYSNEDDMNIDNDEGPEIELEIMDANNPEDEEEEDEEGDEEEGSAEPFVEDNATESENLSLDDMIEELEYDEEEDDESESDEDGEDDDQMDGDQEMGDDDADIMIEEQEMDSDELESEMQADGNQAEIMGFIEDQDDEDLDVLGGAPGDQNDGGDNTDVFNVIEIEEDGRQDEMDDDIADEGPYAVDHDEDDDDIDEDDGMPHAEDLGFHHLLNMLHRNRDRDRGRPPMIFRGLEQRDRDGLFQMGVGGAQRRHRRQDAPVQRRGLDSLYNVERSYNDNEFWEANMNAHPMGGHRNRQNRGLEDRVEWRDPFSNFLARDIQEIRERIGDSSFGFGRGRARDRERERNEVKPPSNPFEVLRKLQSQDKDTTENKLEKVCEVTNIDKRPSKEEIEKANKEKEEKEKKEQKKRDNKKEGKKDEQNKEPNESKDDLDQTEIVQRMENMGLRRSSEEQPDNQQDQPGEQNQPDAQENQNQPQPDEENKNQQQENSAKEQQDVNIESADEHSSQMQVEENKESAQQRPEGTSDQQQPNQEQPSDSQNQPSQPMSEEEKKIKNILDAFGLTKEQVQNSGIDIDVLGFLPEMELVSILSDIASTSQRNEPSSNQQNENQPSSQANVEPQNQAQNVASNRTEEAMQNLGNSQPMDQQNLGNQPSGDNQNQPQAPQQPPVQQPAPQQPASQQPSQQNPPLQPPAPQQQPAQSNRPNQPPQTQPQSNAQLDQNALTNMMNTLFQNQNNMQSVGQAVNPVPPPGGQNQQNMPYSQDQMANIAASLENAMMGMNSMNSQPGNQQQNQFAGYPPFAVPGMGQAPQSNQFNLPQNPFAASRQNQQNQPQQPPAPGSQAQNQPEGQNQPQAEGGNQPAEGESNRNPNLPEGIDEEFFNSLPEDCKQELLRNEDMLRRNLGQPSAPSNPANVENAEQMDTASFLATITDEALRRDILLGMDQQTLATLPPRIRSEAQRYEREAMRRRYRQEREDEPARLLRRMMERSNDHRGVMREHRDRPEKEQKEKYDNFMEIIKRREERYSKASSEASDISKNTISVVFSDDKNLKNLMKIIIVESQRKNQIKFERLVKPFEHLCKNSIIRSKYNQCLMLILNNFKKFSHEIQYSYIRNNNVYVDSIFPPVFMISEDNRTIEEIQYQKIALLVFKIFNSETNKYSANNTELIKSFFTKEPKKPHNQVQNWFTQFEKDKSTIEFIEDSPFLCLLKYILSEDFYSNQNDMSEMLKIASNLLKKYLRPIKDKVITVDSETLEILFKLITLKVEQDFIKQICILFYNISLLSHQDIFANIKKSIQDAIPAVEEQLKDEINDKKKEADREKRMSQDSKMSLEEAKKAMAADDGEEVINTGNRNMPRAYSLSIDGPSTQAIVQASRDKSLMLEKAPRLERLLKVFKMLVHQFSKHSRNSHLNEEDKNKGKFLKENIFKIIEIDELKKLFELFGDYLSMLSDNDINDTVRMVGLSMFLCYQEDFKKIDQKVFTEDFNKPHITMQDYHLAEKKNVTNFIDEEYFKDSRVSFFIDLCTKNSKIFNTLIRQNQSMLRDSLKHMIYVVPQLFDFDNKHYFFRQEIKKIKRSGGHDRLRIVVNRNRMLRIFEESYEQMNAYSPEEWKAKLEVTFAEERGQDAGGLTREWFTEISRQMFDPNLGIFKLSDSGSTYYPNPRSFIQNEHLEYFRFIGRIIGKALLEEQYIECSFVKALYKIIRGVPLTWHDVEDYDNAYYNNLKWLLDNDAEILQQSFCETIDFFGKAEVHDLIPNGRDIPVTNENKKEYIQKVSFFKLYTSIKSQIDSFLKGFYELIPRKLISIFDHGELELLISGLPTIDIDDMKANTEYAGYTEKSHVIQWFWEVMHELSNPEKAEFLQFLTGSSKVPIEGFVALQGMRGPQKFSIHKAYVDDFNRLPVAHTCFNQLDMPDYPSKELLRERLLFAIREGKGGFHIA